MEFSGEICGYKYIDLEPVCETVKEHEVIVRGKPFTAKLYRRLGLAKYIEDDGREILADWATFDDLGAYGVSRGYTKHKKIPPTEEERAEGRRRLLETTTQGLIRQGIW